MEKSETMKRYEAETGKQSTRFVTDGIHSAGIEVWHFEYIAWLETKANISDEAIEAFQEIIRNQCDEISSLKEKAEAYDRLMSGGKKTLKEWANLLGRPVAMDFGGVVESYNSVPVRCDSAGYWFCDEYAENFEDEHFIIPNEVVDFTGSWQDSLTLPDGWED